MKEKDAQFLSKEFFPTSKELINESLSGDPEITTFLVEWLNNGQNATKAYLSLHPDVSVASAGVLGCRKLKKVNVADILSAHNLGIDTFITELKEGLNVCKLDAEGNAIPDNKTRFTYVQLHAKLLNLH